MSESTFTIDPVTRIEGHLAVRVHQEGGAITEARCSGTMLRGLELILGGRDPRDAPILMQRICGVCPQAHATASARALDEAFGVAASIPANGRLLRDILLACEHLHSHILHFYHLAALDYVDVTAVKDYAGSDSDLLSVKGFIARGSLQPFVPRYEGDWRLSAEESIAAVKHYVEALQVRASAHELGALFGGKMPHQCTVNVGGVGTSVTPDKVVRGLAYAQGIQRFVERAYIPDVLLLAERYPDYFEVGKGCGRFLSYGAFDSTGEPLLSSGIAQTGGEAAAVDRDRISEQVASSWYADQPAASPFDAVTIPDPDRKDAYSWIKSPRYDGAACEVGPLARAVVSCAKQNAAVKAALAPVLEKAGVVAAQLDSVMGRHLCRAVEAQLVAGALQEWLVALRPGEPCTLQAEAPASGRGAGLLDVARGALGHWVTIEGGKIKNYQAIVPTTWNASPRDAAGVPGPIEQAIENEKVRDPSSPVEVVRIIRSFDPCLACAVHVLDRRGEVRLDMPVL